MRARLTRRRLLLGTLPAALGLVACQPAAPMLNGPVAQIGAPTPITIIAPVRAERDLQAARNMLSASPPLPEISVYHVQQAVEKCLKAFLTLHGSIFPLTHDLRDIRAQCEAIDARFAQFVTAVQVINPYATLFRYPVVRSRRPRPTPSTPSSSPMASSLSYARCSDAIRFARGTIVATTTQPTYAIQFLIDREWVDWYTTPDRDDAERVWRRLPGVGLQGETRLVTIDVIRSSLGPSAA